MKIRVAPIDHSINSVKKYALKCRVLLEFWFDTTDNVYECRFAIPDEKYNIFGYGDCLNNAFRDFEEHFTCLMDRYFEDKVEGHWESVSWALCRRMESLIVGAAQ